MKSFLRLFNAFLLTVLLVASAANAQDDTLTDSQRDAIFAEFKAITFDRNRAYLLNKALLTDSFAAHLGDRKSRVTVEDISALPAAYDPASDTVLTAGMALFHLAHSNALLRRLGGSANETFVQIIEMRLLWLAGDPDRALIRARDLIANLDRLDSGDPIQTSLLTDAAVLSYRAGNAETARAYLARARACGVPDCPDDMLFGWIGSGKDDRIAISDDYDPFVLRDRALETAARLFPGNDEIAADIRSEAILMAGRSGSMLAEAVALTQSGADPETLTNVQRRDLRQLAERMLGVHDFVAYMMNSDSVAGHMTWERKPWGDAEEDLEDIGYLDTDSPFDDLLMQNLPIIHALASFSDRPGDWVVADLMRIRTILSKGQRDRGLQELQKLQAAARAAGFSDAQIFSVHMDIWAVARLTDQPDIAARALAATDACRARGCPQDLSLRFYKRAEILPRIGLPDGLRDSLLAAADPFLRANFPDDLLELAELYRVGVGGALYAPMDAARLDLVAMGIVENAPQVTPAELASWAANVMDTLVYAGQYNQAASLGDRIAARLVAAGAEDAFTAKFWRFRARAAFWLDDPKAADFYDRAVSLAPFSAGIHRDLALDLLDTPYLDQLDRLVGGDGASGTILARLRYRQGRYSDAADVLATMRREIEVQADQNVPRDHPALYEGNTQLRDLAFQEAVYRDAAGDPTRAEALRNLASGPFMAYEWIPLDDISAETALTVFGNEPSGISSSYDYIRGVIELRDTGNYEAAAQHMRGYSTIARAAEANGEYVDAQTLWQMAFTFARVGESETAFDLMNRAARIAANLSFKGAGGADGGTLQLLERDRWRYLLFVDIAWAAVTGQAPEDMLVVSRY